MNLIIKTSLLALIVSLAGCETASKKLSNLSSGSLSSKNSAAAYRATGYAPISVQPGKSRGEKVINAIRASKLRAYQELAAMVHGQYISSTSTVEDMVLINDNFKTAVAGIVRGARVIKSYPVQDDVYATILEVTAGQVQQAWIVNNN